MGLNIKALLTCDANLLTFLLVHSCLTWTIQAISCSNDNLEGMEVLRNTPIASASSFINEEEDGAIEFSLVWAAQVGHRPLQRFYHDVVRSISSSDHHPRIPNWLNT